jgi:hypothetical protein
MKQRLQRQPEQGLHYRAHHAPEAGNVPNSVVSKRHVFESPMTTESKRCGLPTALLYY